MNTEQAISYIKENNIQKVKFAFADVDGILRGKVISTQKFIDGLQGGYRFLRCCFWMG
jgi:glutamine synthetase